MAKHAHNHVKGELTVATRETEAYYTYACACGDSYTEEVKGTFEAFNFNHAVLLESEYILLFRVDTAKVNARSEITDHWFEITRYPHVDGEITATTDTVEAELYVGTNGERWEAQAPAIDAKCMNDKVEAVYYQIKDGIKYATHVDEYNLVSYYKQTLTRESSAKTAKVVAEMMNYGATAQKKFNYNTETIADDVYSGYINRHIDASRHTIKSEFAAYSDIVLTQERTPHGDKVGKAFTVRSNTGILGSKITLVIKYDINATVAAALDYSTLEFRGSYETTVGTPMEIVISGDDEDFYLNGSILEVSIDTLAVKDLRQLITGAIYDAEGNKVSETCDFSFECYANAAYNKAQNEIDKHIAAAVISFCDAAIEVFSE